MQNFNLHHIFAVTTELLLAT